MANDDTINLLKECNAGVKMAVSSFDEILPLIKGKEMRDLIERCKEVHEKIGNKTHELLNEYDDKDKEPNPVAKVMSWMKVNVKMMTNSKDSEAADIMVDGCNMGVKSLCKYLNKYVTADDISKSFAKELITLEERLMVDLRKYL